MCSRWRALDASDAGTGSALGCMTALDRPRTASSAGLRTHVRRRQASRGGRSRVEGRQSPTWSSWPVRTDAVRTPATPRTA